MSEPVGKVLDHGYVRIIDSWGSDQAIVEAARMSTQKGFLGWGPKCTNPECDASGPEVVTPIVCRKCGTAHRPEELKQGDEKLLRYLYEHKHSTPFEMAGITIEVQAPIFVFREWHRHRTQSYSEMSARYAPLPDVNYIPTVERLMMSGGANRQAGSAKDAQALTENEAETFRGLLADTYYQLESLYQSALQKGVPKELARVILPVGRYSRMRASANLRNWLAFLTLRMDAHAQYEIRQYAGEVGRLVAAIFPRTWELFVGGAK